jgi:hypothetical protein
MPRAEPRVELVSLPPADLWRFLRRAVAIGLKAANGPSSPARSRGRDGRRRARELLDTSSPPIGSTIAARCADSPARRRCVGYPIGTVLYAPFWISDVRISPDAKQLAFVTHNGGDEGDVK